MKIRECNVTADKNGIRVHVKFGVQPNVEAISKALQKGVSLVDYDYGIVFIVAGFSNFLECWHKIVTIFSEMETEKEKIKDFLSKQV